MFLRCSTSLTLLKLMGLAVYNSINLDIRLPLCCYKKLLSPAVVPFENPHAPVGMAQLGLDDLNDVNPVSVKDFHAVMYQSFYWIESDNILSNLAHQKHKNMKFNLNSLRGC